MNQLSGRIPIMEDFNEPLQLEFTLKRLSMTALLGNIYDHPDIKTKMQSVIRTKDRGVPYAFPSTCIKKEILKLASQKIQTLDLPKNLLSEVQGISIFFAKKISIWADYIIRMVMLDSSYLDKMYWTIYGTVDDAKIFDVYWQSHKNFSTVLKTDRESNNEFVSRMSCQFANEEIILVLQHAIIEIVQKHLKRVKLPNIQNKIDQLIVSYLCYVYGEVYDMEQGKDVYRRFKHSGKLNVSEAIFIAEGNAGAIKFLWNFISDSDKEKIVMPLAQLNLNGGLDCGRMSFAVDDPCMNEIEMIEISKCAEAVIFLINQMSPKQRIQFLTKNIVGIMELFLMVWPYPEVCQKILNKEWICEVILHKNIGGAILKLLLFRMLKDLADAKYVSGTCHYPNVFYEIFKKILGLTSKEVKEVVFFGTEYYSVIRKGFVNVIENLYDIFDLNALSLVVNDKDLKHKRSMMIKMGSKKISELIRKGKAGLLIRFMEKVLISHEERKKFVEQWDLQKDVAAEDKHSFREKISNWLVSAFKF